MSTRKVALTGASGFLGVHVAGELLAAGFEVVIIDRGSRSLPDALAEVEVRRWDSREAIDPGLLAGCDALVNMVGIKRERGAATFEFVHVELVRRLREASSAAGLTRMIHISVAGARPDARSAYLDSKHRGEQALTEPGPIAPTILRPGIIHGPGDDFVHNLADSIRAAPIFVAPRPKEPIQVVAVADVARAVRLCLEREQSAGRSYDVVGPETLTIALALERVAAVVGRRSRVLALPSAWLRPVAALMERTRDPLITRSQLHLLGAGVVGDAEPARRELGLEPTPFDRRSIESALIGVRSRLPSLRLIPDLALEAQVRALGGTAPLAATMLLGMLAIVLLLLGPWLIPGPTPWLRMPLLEGLLALISLAGSFVVWRVAARPSVKGTLIGLVLALAMVGAALVTTSLIAWLAPEMWRGAADLYLWARDIEFGWALLSLVVVVAAEEVVWRGVLGIGLASALLARGRSAWLALLISALAFMVAHLTTGNPLLWLAALLAGGVWTAIAIRTRSLWISFVCHLAWDASLLWLIPLV